MSDSLLHYLEKVNDLVQDVIRENTTLKAQVTKPSNRKKLTPRDVLLVRQMHRAGHTQAGIATSFDINPATVSRIVRGQYHKGTR